MEIGSHEIELKHDTDAATVFAFGDLHLASTAFEERQFKNLVQKIADTEKCIWFGMGDFGESINPKDRRFDQESLRPKYREHIHRLAQEEAYELIGLLTPIKDKCGGILVGNHEQVLRTQFSYDLTWELCNHFGWKHLSSEALFRLYLLTCGSRRKVDIFLAHGYGGGRKWGSKINKLSDIAAGVRAEIYLIAHIHSRGAIKEIELALPAKGKLHLLQKERMGIIVPSFFKTYEEGQDNYASRTLYPPSVIGGTEIRLSYSRERPSRDWKLNMSTVI
jgi:hypothetical protein|tara:strand:+ start:4362 stop:5192 length:831 start_codon:yes stop_codon:yes gene_type:complete